MKRFYAILVGWIFSVFLCGFVIAQELDLTRGSTSETLDKYELRKESFTELERLAKFLNDNPGYAAEIHGHTDSQGEEAYNENLSIKRAQTVVDFLISAGCSPHNLNAIGFGESEPIASNDTEDSRQKNRRVEFRIIQTTTKK